MNNITKEDKDKLNIIFTSPDNVRILINGVYTFNNMKKIMGLYPNNTNRVYIFKDYKFYTWKLKRKCRAVSIEGDILFKEVSSNFNRSEIQYHRDNKNT